MSSPSWLGKDELEKAVEQKGNWVKWGKAGDGFKGILISRERGMKKNYEGTKEEMRETYEFYMLGGEFHDADKKGNVIEPAITIKEGSKYFCDDSKRIGNGMRDIRLGDEVIILLEEIAPNKDPKFNDVKMIKVRLARHHDDWVAKTAGASDAPEGEEKPNIMAPDFVGGKK